MRRLTLLRHAKSSWSEAGLPDHERPLSDRGEADARRMGERLRVRRVRPSLIITSTAHRARATASRIATALGYPREFVHSEPALYLADPAAILSVVALQEEEFSDLMLVGHNPGLTELVNSLLPDMRLDNLPTTGIVAVQSSSQSWPELAARNTTLDFYDFPKNPEVLIARE